MEITTITVAKGQIKLSLTPKLRMQLEKGRLRAINRLVGTDQFVRNATVVTEGNVGATNRSATSVDSWDYKKHCPVKETKEGQAKLNAVNAGEAARHDLVQGMISIKGVSALLLFDSGSTHSLMSYSLIRKLNLETRILEPPLIVNVPSGERILADKQVGPVVMHLQGKCMA